MLVERIKQLINNPRRIFIGLLIRTAVIWPDKLYLQLRYYFEMGQKLNLKNPRTFNEKLQWLKLYNRKPEYTIMVDKFAVKQYVSDIIGKEYIIPTIGVWNRIEDIDWHSLPNQFVLKTTHGGGSGGVVICKDKDKFDKIEAFRKLQRSLNSDIYRDYREWPYKNVPKRIIAEKYMMESISQNEDSDLVDYKFYCFNGMPAYCQVIRDRNTKETIDFYDMEWNHMPFVGLNPVISNGLNPVIRPLHLKKMIEISRLLSKNIPFTRIDLYLIDDKIYFGEITFYPASGLGTFTPTEWNYILGEMLELPLK